MILDFIPTIHLQISVMIRSNKKINSVYFNIFSSNKPEARENSLRCHEERLCKSLRCTGVKKQQKKNHVRCKDMDVQCERGEEKRRQFFHSDLE